MFNMDFDIYIFFIDSSVGGDGASNKQSGIFLCMDIIIQYLPNAPQIKPNQLFSQLKRDFLANEKKNCFLSVNRSNEVYVLLISSI